MMCIRAYLVVYAHHLCSPNHPLDTCFNLKDSSIFRSTPRIKAKAGFNIQCLAFLSAAMNCNIPFSLFWLRAIVASALISSILGPVNRFFLIMVVFEPARLLIDKYINISIE